MDANIQSDAYVKLRYPYYIYKITHIIFVP